MAVLPIKEARGKLGALVRDAVVEGTCTYISLNGKISAAVVSVQELEDQEDTIAVLANELRRARGEEVPTFALDEVKRELGL